MVEKLGKCGMIIDAHTHAYAADVVADPVEWGQARGEDHWVELVTTGPQGWAMMGGMLEQMDAHAVGKAVLAGWYWEHLRTAEEQNAWHLDWATAAPGRFLPFISTQPSAGEACLRSVKAALETGRFFGIGELMPAAQGFSLRDDTFQELCKLAHKADVPVLLHVTEPVGHSYPGRLDTPLEDYVWLAEQHPELKLILAHWGGGLPFFMHNRRVRRALHRVWFDTAASPLLYSAAVWDSVVRCVGSDRILFGTDYPLKLYPRQDLVPGYARILDEIAAALPEKAIRDAVLGGNASRLFNITD